MSILPLGPLRVADVAFWLSVVALLGATVMVPMRRADELRAQLASQEEWFTSSVEGAVSAQSATLKHIGQVLTWPDSLTRVNEDVWGGTSTDATPGRLVVVLDPRQCTVVRNGVTTLVERLVRDTDSPSIVAVIVGMDESWAYGYAQATGFRFPVYADPDRAFAEANGLDIFPLTLLEGSTGAVVAANVPSQVLPSLSLPFERLVLRMLGPTDSRAQAESPKGPTPSAMPSAGSAVRDTPTSDS